MLKVIRRRPFTLIEVMISIAILTLTLIPLLYPHYAILREGQLFLHEVEVDRLINLEYKEELKRFFRGSVNWESEWDKEVELEEKLVGFKVIKTITLVKNKPKDEPKYILIKTEYRLFNGKKEQKIAFYAVVEKKD